MKERTKRSALIAGGIALALLSIGAGALIALSSDDGERRAGPGRTPSATATPTDEPSGTPEPTETPPQTGSPILADGRHFVFVEDATLKGNGAPRVTVDLAYFYRGDRAEQEAAERGDEVVNDYYVVNENPRLRRLPLADDVEVEYIPASACCELQPGNIDAWLEAVRETNPTDYAGKGAPWWFTVEGGRVTLIEQQYLS